MAGEQAGIAGGCGVQHQVLPCSCAVSPSVSECRDVLLPLLTDQLSGQLDDNASKPDHEASSQLLSSILEVLDRKDVVSAVAADGSTAHTGPVAEGKNGSVWPSGPRAWPRQLRIWVLGRPPPFWKWLEACPCWRLLCKSWPGESTCHWAWHCPLLLLVLFETPMSTCQNQRPVYMLLFMQKPRPSWPLVPDHTIVDVPELLASSHFHSVSDTDPSEPRGNYMFPYLASSL